MEEEETAMLDPMRFDLLLAERRRAVEDHVEAQRRRRLLALTHSGPARRCCRWLGVRLQAWGLALQRYAQAGAAPAGWEEQPS